MSDPRRESADQTHRREFLRRILRTSAYLPPAVAVVSMRNVAVAQATCAKQAGNSGMCIPGQGP